MEDIKKRCTHFGCLKEYYEKDNVEGCCKYHDGKPMFHDTKKGWTCCNQVAYDWDEFQKIAPCKVGKHTDIPLNKIDFYKSDTVSNAQKAINNNEKVKVMNINDYNKAQEQKAKDESSKSEKPKEVITNSEGKYYCAHHGCKDKVYDPNKNEEGSCHYHLGQPMFHDRKKYWTCCKAEAYEWDEFDKLPACAVGKHEPKYK